MESLIPPRSDRRGIYAITKLSEDGFERLSRIFAERLDNPERLDPLIAEQVPDIKSSDVHGLSNAIVRMFVEKTRRGLSSQEFAISSVTGLSSAEPPPDFTSEELDAAKTRVEKLMSQKGQIDLTGAAKATAKLISRYRTLSNSKEKLSTKQAMQRVDELGRINKNDTRELRKKKLDALWALSDAAMASGMEPWSMERINEEVAKLRGQDKLSYVFR